jgi:molybdate transport system substrate-binding protein
MNLACARIVAAVFLPFCGACGDGAAGASAPPPDAVLVAAASSLRELLEATAPGFLGGRPSARVTFSFEASSTLARKIEHGARFDVFVSADQESIEQVRGDLDAATIAPVLANRLALVRRDDLLSPVSSLEGLRDAPGRIAVAGPAVPAGRYARTFFSRIGLLEALEPRFVEAHSVRGALALVESAAADYAVVYETDTRNARRAVLAWSDRAGRSPEVRYVAAVLDRSRSPAARAYAAFLRSEPFLAAAEAAGFRRPAP